ncbi:MAG: hypothetical protein ACR2O4_09970 [Hyphomicrobiaceae bacterium]
MRSRIRSLSAASIMFAVATAYSVSADARVSKYCQGDRHMHYGSGGGPSKKAARRAAIQSWADFTAFEYGNAFANYRNARFKRIACSRSSSGWSCDVEANPCRVARTTAKRRQGKRRGLTKN